MRVFEYLPTDEDRTAAFELAQRIAFNTWVLFGGAGVSMQSGLPLASRLINRLETDLELPQGTLSSNDLAKACSRYQFTPGKGREALIAFLRRELDTTDREPSWLHDLLLELGPPEILTTNPEDLWEKALMRRNIPFLMIVRGTDWGRYTDQVPLVKLHGDLTQPDTLVFTEEDYRQYPRDEILSTDLRALMVRKSFFFAGYSASDENLRREIQWVVDRLEGGSRPHFLLTDQIEGWRRIQFAVQNIQVIALGDYGRLRQFLSELTLEVNRLRPQRRLPIIAGLEATAPGLHHKVLVELFQDLYEPIRVAITEWRLVEAETGLNELIREVEQITERRPEIIEVLRDFQQRLLLALGNVLHWRGRRQEALQLWDQVQAIGTLEPSRRLQAATFLANVANTTGLSQLLAEGPLEPSEHHKLTAMLRWLEGNIEQVAQLIPNDTIDVDLAILKVRVLLAKLSEETVSEAIHHLDRAWNIVQGQPLPMGMIQIAELTDAILRRVVSEGWVTPTLDRRELLRTICERYRQTVLAAEGFIDSFPEVLIEALSAAMQFHGYLDEEETVAMYRDRLQTVPGMTRSRVVAEYLAAGEGAALDTINALYRGGYISLAEKALLTSRHLIEMGSPEQGEESLRAALPMAANDAEREAILISLLELLVDRERISEAEALLAQEHRISSEFVALMHSLVVLQRQGRIAAVKRLREFLASHPNSRMILHNLIRFLIHEAQERRRHPSAAREGQDASGALLQEARRYAEQLVQILPSPEAYLRLAGVLAESEDFEGGLQVLQGIVADGYVTRHVLLWQGQFLMKLQQPREAAAILDRAVDQYPKDYNLALFCGSAWAAAHEHGRAIARMEPLLESSEARSGLFIGLGSVYLQRAASDPSSASRAFDLFKQAFEQEPTEPTLPMRLVIAGQASGRSREAWELISRLDLSHNPYLRAMPEEEALPLLREQTAHSRQRQVQYEAGMIPFPTFAEHASRPAWFLWWARMAVFQRSWQSGDLVAKPLLVDLPSIRSALGDVDSLRHGLLLDMTAILTLGTLGVMREILEVLRVAHCPVYLFPGCMRWLDREVSLLQTDQLPWYRERFRQLQELLQRARAVVEIKHEPVSGDSVLSETTREMLGLIGVDLEHAIVAQAYYLDDYVESDNLAHLPGGVRISSAQVLASMVGQGLVRPEEATHIQNEQPEPFRNWTVSEPVPLDRPVLMAEPTLLAWYEAGLLDRWVQGGEGWPSIIVGPWAWSSLMAHATEGLLYREALQRAEATREALEEVMRQRFIQECPAAPAVSIELAGLQQSWAPALALLVAAKERNLVVWTDDLFLRLIMDRRGLLSEDATFRPLEERVRGVFAGVVVAGTEGVLRILTEAGALSEAREGQLVWSLMVHGYRVLRLQQALRWWLQQVPYTPNSLAVPYRQLLRDLKQVVGWIPEGVGADRRALFARTTIVAITTGLIAEVWAATAPGFPDAHRRHLAEALLRIFEEAMEG